MDAIVDERLIAFDNSYAQLDERFYTKLAPTPVEAPTMLRFNHQLAQALGLDADALATRAEIFAGNRLPEGAEPLAQVYAGHQFGNWAPQLGDGRAHLIGEIIAPDGGRYDLQLKGSGRTPYSRMGDGRAALGPVIREYLVSEAMAGLGIPTTRALAAVGTGETVLRDQGSEPGGVLARIARSHLRVGSFQYFLSQGDDAAIKTLADYAISRHYPEAAEAENPYIALLAAVGEAQGRLIAQWMHAGFIHGVMNRDNMSIAGETIDFGPCAFMDAYKADKVFSSIDMWGRYAYGSQPPIGSWNLARFAETLLKLIDEDEKAAVTKAESALARYVETYKGAATAGWRAKLGLARGRDGDEALVNDLLSLMEQGLADFTLTFRMLSSLKRETSQGDPAFLSLFENTREAEGWLDRWRARLSDEPSSDAERQAAMRAVNPAFIARNHQVERAIRGAYEGDMTLFEDLLSVLASPYEAHPGLEAYAEPPKAGEEVQKTFCGT